MAMLHMMAAQLYQINQAGGPLQGILAVPVPPTVIISLFQLPAPVISDNRCIYGTHWREKSHWTGLCSPLPLLLTNRDRWRQRALGEGLKFRKTPRVGKGANGLVLSSQESLQLVTYHHKQGSG